MTQTEQEELALEVLKLTGVELCRLSAPLFGAFCPFCFDGRQPICTK